MKHRYDVALSFAGEDREYVRDVAHILKNSGIKVFYDEFEEDVLWGTNLYTHLKEIYSEQAKYTIMFCSKHYADKAWTNHERECAQEKAFRENSTYILPAKFDDTKIPGLLDTTAYIDLTNLSPLAFCEKIGEKLNIKIDTSNDIDKLLPALQLDRHFEQRIKRLGVFHELYSLSMNEEYKDDILSFCSKKSPRSIPDAITAANIGRLLIPTTLKTNVWSLRQTLGQIIGHIYNNFNDDILLEHEISTVSEQNIGSYGGEIILSLALTQGKLPAVVGRRHIKKLFSSNNPQIGWQFFKKWFFIRPINDISNYFDPNESLNDSWRRRRLIISLVVMMSNMPSFFSAGEKRLLYYAVKKEIELHGYRFLISLHLWLYFSLKISIFEEIGDRKFSRIFLEISERIHALSLHRELNISKMNFTSPPLPTEDNLHIYSYLIDMCCLNLDSPKMEYNHMGQGRYSKILEWTNKVFDFSHEKSREILIWELLKCNDEGIRWAIAKIIHTLPLKKESLVNATSALLCDWHPWVVREAIDSISRNEIFTSENIKGHFLTDITRKISELKRNNNLSANEAKIALMKLVIERPELSSELDVIGNN